MTDKITIEQLTNVYRITRGDYTAVIHGNDELLNEVRSLCNGDELSQQGQHPGGIPQGNYHKEDNYSKTSPEKLPPVPVIKQGVTRTKVHALLDEGVSIADIAEKLGLTEAAIIYHEKSHVKKDVQDPDADLKPMLTGVIDTSTKYDGNDIGGVD